MAAKAHAILSASSSDRWLHCPPSARLCETYEDKGSDYAAEGTDAHALGEFKIKSALGLPAEDPTKSLKWYSEEMEDCASGYAEYVLEQVEASKETCSDPVVLIEQRVDFSRWVEQGFGTADCIIIADGTLRIIDYKHGLGVLVSADENPQMQCYALGALELFDGIYDIDQVSMTIYQPRRQNISTFEISKDALYRWADEVLKPTAELAFAGDGNFLCGEWCGFCKAKNECRARAEAINSVESTKMATYSYMNAMPYTLGEDPVFIVSLEFATQEETDCEFKAAVLINVTAEPVDRSVTAEGTGTTRCHMLFVKDDALKQAFTTMLNKLIFSHRQILKPYLESLKTSSSDDSLHRIQQIQTLLAQNTEKRETLTMLMTQGIIDPVLYSQETNELLSQADSFRDEIEALKNEVSGDVNKVTETTALIHFAEKSAMLQEFDKDLFDRYVKRIIVHSRNDIRFELKCGLTLRERK